MIMLCPASDPCWDLDSQNDLALYFLPSPRHLPNPRAHSLTIRPCESSGHPANPQPKSCPRFTLSKLDHRMIASSAVELFNPDSEPSKTLLYLSRNPSPGIHLTIAEILRQVINLPTPISGRSCPADSLAGSQFLLCNTGYQRTSSRPSFVRCIELGYEQEIWRIGSHDTLMDLVARGRIVEEKEQDNAQTNPMVWLEEARPHWCHIGLRSSSAQYDLQERRLW
ncbi:hypothetical protein C8J56DRAFT_408154 [Mycena floridula]|nr:hypothetical protein C8J56DRAFT_408154 [Mycena floridula]